MANHKPLTYELMVSGDVQGVGYRRAVQRIARKMNITGFVKNLPDGRVRIVVQCGDSETLEEFAKAISLRSPPIFVDGVERKALKSQARLKYFKIESGALAEEMQEGFGSMESQFNDYREDFNDYRKEFKDYRGEFKSFSERTDSSFKFMDAKYGEISSKLTEILKSLQTENLEAIRSLNRSVDTLVKAVEKVSPTNQTN